MTRREFRKEVVNQLYQLDLLGKNELKEVYNQEVLKTFNEVLVKMEEIDDLISNHLINYTIDRLSFVDRAIIRLAVYEMLYTDTPSNIVINEAIELTKDLADIDDKQKSFTNRLLDNIKKEIGD